MKTIRYSLAAASMLLAAQVVQAASQSPPTPSLRLGDAARPVRYSAELVVVPEQSTFEGQIAIDLELKQPTSFLWLHGHGLTVTNAHLEQRGHTIAAQPVVGGDEFLGFRFQQVAKAGKARLSVSYFGEMSDRDFSGLFRRPDNGQWYAATQFEATWARRVFPCFDEPGFKVPWQLTLHVKQEHTALGNSPVVSETKEPGGMKCVQFAQTRPLPSYLVALAVGPFEAVDLGRIGKKNTPVRIFTPKGRTNEAAFAAQAIPPLLRRLEEYYGIAYPYDKLDHLAMPQFPEAMENAGLIIHGDTIILSPPDRLTIEFKRGCANVCTHEMAHQWFGDLVTMAWWDDLWLNESFATWISPKMVDSWQPDWRTSLDQLESSFASASADSLVNARRIRQPIETETDIDNAFDDITYGKGAAVLGMFESWVGNETFRNAIRAYLKGHAYTSATTSDFLESLNHGAKQDVGSAFSTFLDQPGIPLVTVKSVGSSNGRRSAVLSQRRFLPVGSSGASTNIWKIPLQLRYQSDGDEAESRFMLDRPQQTASLNTEPTGLQWLLLDRDGVGYYISAYSGDWLRSLLEAGAAKLSAAERMTIAHSISAAVRSADLPLGEALSLQGKLLLDPERRVVQMAAGFLDVREKVPPDLVPNYHRFIQKSLEPLMRGISWQSLRPETDDERLQRLALLVLAAHAGEDSRLIEEAKRLAAAWIENRQAVPPDEAATVLWIAGRHADSGLFDKLMAEAKKTQESSDRQRLITALGAVQDPALAQRALDALVARSFQSVDSETLLAVLSGHVETRSLTYEYLKQHFDAVVAALPADSMFWYLPNAAEGFDTSERQKDVQSFFKNKDVKVTGGPRIIAQVLERIHLNQAFKEAQLPSLIEFLQKQ